MKVLFFAALISTSSLFGECVDLTQKKDIDVFCHLDEDLMSLEQIVKEISMNPAQTNQMRNQLVLQIMDKAHYADDVASILSGYFLQERISPKDPDVDEKLKLVHNMLVISYQIKHAVDIQMVMKLKRDLYAFRTMVLPDKILNQKGLMKKSKPKYRNKSFPRQL